MYIKREVLKKIGLFDHKFIMGFEDVDFCLRAREAGFKIIYTPNAVLTHFESATRGRGINKSHTKSLKYFWNKWGNYFNNRKVVNKKKLNIIYILQDTGVGGGHRDVFEHINGLVEKGHNVALYALTSQPEWFDLKIKVKKFINYKSMEDDLVNQHAIKVACWWESAEVVWRSSLQKGIPIYFVQDIETSYYKNDTKAQNKVLATYRKDFNYITISKWNKNELQKMNIYSTIVSPGLNLKKFYLKKLKRRKNVILTIGRRLHLKNLEQKIKAWERIINEVEFWIFGIDPSIYHELKAKHPNAKIKFFFKPSDEKIVRLYNEATIFVQTSTHEGFCLPVLEAMACGCPVITTDSDGNMDFCIDNKNCLITSKNDVNELANKILRLLNSQKQQDKLRNEGLKTVKNYSWETKIDELEKFYLKLAEKKLYSVDINAEFDLSIFK
jgi:glycosyltransferase involved in cell wall biosynthesis